MSHEIASSSELNPAHEENLETSLALSRLGEEEEEFPHILRKALIEASHLLRKEISGN